MSQVKTDPNQRIAIAILAKAPIPGLSKTRLIPHLGAEGAAALQGWLIQRTVATALNANLGPVTLWCTPNTQHPDFIQCTQQHDTISLRQQMPGDLGERMHQAIAESPCPAGTLVIGTDCPALDAAHLQAAAAALAINQAVLTPAEDGGYVLIGMQQAARRVFETIEWSSERVMAQTRRQLTEIGWQWSEFSPLWDVDRKEDFERLLLHCPSLAHLITPGGDRPKFDQTVRSPPAPL